MRNREPSSDAALPVYLSGALLLRGRSRILVTACAIGMYFLVIPALRSIVGYAQNAVAALVAILLAWLWGRSVGAVAGFFGIVGNYAWGASAGFGEGVTSATVIDAVLVGLVAAMVGHVGGVLEGALGATAESRRAFTKLEQEARDRMLNITDRIPVGLYRTTPDGRVINGNDALMRILGFADMDSMLQANVWNHYLDRGERRAKLDELGEPVWSEYELRKADGSVMWVRDWAKPVSNEKGELQHYDGVIEDITDQRVANEMFRAAFEEAPTGMSIFSTEGRLVRGNQAVADMLGRPIDELAGLHFSEWTRPEDMSITPTALEGAAAGQVVNYDKRLLRPDGSMFWAEITLAPILEVSQPGFLIAHVVDETERRRVREALESLVRSKDELIASVSHELRTPLTVIHGLAQELNTNWIGFSVLEQKEFIGMVAEHAEEVVYIVEDLLVAARADIGKLPIHAEALDLREQIIAAASSVSSLEVVPDLVGDAPPVAFADPNRVRQVIRNLLSNAVRYGGEEIHVRCGVVDGGRVFVEVADDGPGVAEEDIDKIFEPYERAHNAYGQPMSVGLGLTVSRTLAELMGGSLTYRHEGRHAIFRLELPVLGAVHSSASVL